MTTQAPRIALINAIINAYHTARPADVYPALWVSQDTMAQRALEEFGRQWITDKIKSLPITTEHDGSKWISYDAFGVILRPLVMRIEPEKPSQIEADHAEHLADIRNADRSFAKPFKP